MKFGGCLSFALRKLIAYQYKTKKPLEGASLLVYLLRNTTPPMHRVQEAWGLL